METQEEQPKNTANRAKIGIEPDNMIGPEGHTALRVAVEIPLALSSS
jgi:hypothetical protein